MTSQPSYTFLIVEDDEFKLGEISKILSDDFPKSTIVQVGSVQQAIAALENEAFDLVVLDIALPSHEIAKGGGTPTSMPSGGIEVLMELAFYNREDLVVIMTQYPEVELDRILVPLSKLGEKVRSMVSINLLDVVLFDKVERDWIPKLRKIMGAAL